MICNSHNLKTTRSGTQRVCINGACEYWEVIPGTEERSTSPTVEASDLRSVESGFESQVLHDGSSNSATPASKKQKQVKKAKGNSMAKKKLAQALNTAVTTAVVTPTAIAQTPAPLPANGNSKFALTMGVPIPEGGTRSVYPFPDMQVGHSFEVIGEKAINNVRNAAQKFKSTHEGRDFASRKMGDTAQGQPVYRFWRRA